MRKLNTTHQAHILSTVFAKASALAFTKLKDSDGDSTDAKLVEILSERILSNPAMLAMAIEAVVLRDGPGEDEINNSLGYLLAGVDGVKDDSDLADDGYGSNDY